jgi:hypothetical protein
MVVPTAQCSQVPIPTSGSENIQILLKSSQFMFRALFSISAQYEPTAKPGTRAEYLTFGRNVYRRSAGYVTREEQQLCPDAVGLLPDRVSSFPRHHHNRLLDDLVTETKLLVMHRNGADSSSWRLSCCCCCCCSSQLHSGDYEEYYLL